MAIARAPRVGILVECGRDGLEDVLCRRICELLREHTGVEFEIDIVPMDNKARLIQDCGAVTARLLDEAATVSSSSGTSDRPGRESVNPCAGITIDEIFLPTCVRHKSPIARCIWSASSVSSKSWLLFDHQMLSAVLSTAAHPVRVGSQRNPDRMQNPKGTMTSLFRQHRGWRYVDVQHATEFARCLQNLNRLLRCATFRRFAEQVTGQRV